MDLIKRTIIRQRESGFSQHFDFTTYSIIFAKPPIGKEMTNFQKLLKYLRWIFIMGIPEKTDGYESCSAVRTPQPKSIEPLMGEENELAQLLQGVNYRGYSKFQHEMVEAHLLKNDKKALAVEVPVYLAAGKTPNKKGWIGEIDLLRVVDQRLQVCDFKPDSSSVNQKQVGAQLYRYVWLMHKLTGIPLADIDGIYFDEKNAYKIII